MAFFDELKDLANNFIKSLAPRQLDPSKFNDPMALKTDWTPLVRGGANFKTKKRVDVSDQRIEFQSSVEGRTFALVFLGMGLLGCWVIVSSALNQAKFQPVLLLPVFIPLIFVAVGGAILKHVTKPIFFDRMNSTFGTGRDKGEQELCRFQDIYALQILVERVRGNKSSYNSYELNLVLKDSSRLNVLDHGKLEEIQNDAQAIADFLGRKIPIWDGTRPEYYVDPRAA